MTKYIVILVIILTILFGFFTYSRKQVIKECDGEKVGEEVGGQSRTIFKCKDGLLKII